jgi:hypothetical protein
MSNNERPSIEEIKSLRQALKDLDRHEKGWRKTALKLATGLWRARRYFKDNEDFHFWLVEQRLEVEKNKQAALISIGEAYEREPAVVQEVLDTTERFSLRYIWELELRPRLRGVASNQPSDDEGRADGESGGKGGSQRPPNDRSQEGLESKVLPARIAAMVKVFESDQFPDRLKRRIDTLKKLPASEQNEWIGHLQDACRDLRALLRQLIELTNQAKSYAAPQPLPSDPDDEAADPDDPLGPPGAHGPDEPHGPIEV